MSVTVFKQAIGKLIPLGHLLGYQKFTTVLVE